MAETFLDSSTHITSFAFTKYEELFYGKNSHDFKIAAPGSNSANTLDLKSDYYKILILPNGGMFHINADAISQIVSILLSTDFKIIVDLKRLDADRYKDNNKNIYEYFCIVIKYLNKIFDNRIVLFNSAEYDFYRINNFFIMSDQYKASMNHSLKAFEYIKNAFDIYESSQEPRYKKVYLSRKYIAKRGPYGNNFPINNIDFTKHTIDDRMIDEDVLEKFFKDNGFEIAYPEEFGSIKDQIKYFSGVDVLVSTTSSGIGNCIFMPKNSTILELVTPFIVENQIGFGNQHYAKEKVLELLHNQYGQLTYILGHTYARIPNYTRRSDDIINYILNNKSIYKFLGLENHG